MDVDHVTGDEPRRSGEKEVDGTPRSRQQTTHFGSDSAFYVRSADVVLIAGAAEYPVHRLTLARESDFFLKMFEDCPVSEGEAKPQRIPLDLLEEDAEALLRQGLPAVGCVG